MKLKLIKFKKVKSTNDVAIKIIRSKKNTRGIVISEEQTKGKGTMGKQWVSQNGNFFASIFFELKNNMPKPNEFSKINLIILKNILNMHSNFDVKIKWPNDLIIKGKKVCGILQELINFDKKNFLIIGIGINTMKSPTNEKFRSTSLLESSNKKISNNKILNDLKKNYELSNWRYWKYKY